MAIKTPKWVSDRSPLTAGRLIKEQPPRIRDIFQKLQHVQEYKDGAERRFKETLQQREPAAIPESLSSLCKGDMAGAAFCLKHRERASMGALRLAAHAVLCCVVLCCAGRHKTAVWFMYKKDEFSVEWSLCSTSQLFHWWNQQYDSVAIRLPLRVCLGKEAINAPLLEKGRDTGDRSCVVPNQHGWQGDRHQPERGILRQKVRVAGDHPQWRYHFLGQQKGRILRVHRSHPWEKVSQNYPPGQYFSVHFFFLFHTPGI